MARAQEIEDVPEEELHLQRRERARQRAAWEQADPGQRLAQRTGDTLDAAKEAIEDTLKLLVSLSGGEGETPARTAQQERLKAVRLQLLDSYREQEVWSKHGPVAMQIFEPAKIDGLTEEQEERLIAFIKEKEERRSKGSESEDDSDEGPGHLTVPAPIPAWACPAGPPLPAGFGQFWSGPGAGGMNWIAGGPGADWQPPAATVGWAPPGDNSGGGWARHGFGGSGYQDGMIAAARARARIRARYQYPCDNCGQMGHWKRSPACPNFHMHLAQLRAASAASQPLAAVGWAGGAAAAHVGPSSTTVMVPFTGYGRFGGN